MNFGESLGFFVLLISLYILWQIRQLLLLIFTAVIFAVALNRLVRKLINFHLSRKIAILIIFFALIIIINILFLLIFPPFIEQFNLLIATLPNVTNRIIEVIKQIDYSQYQDFIPLDINKIINSINVVNTNTINNFFVIFSNAFNFTLQLALVIFLTVVLLLNPNRYRYYFLQLFPSFYRSRATEIFAQTEIAIVSWLSGILINCLFIGTLSGIGLLFLQVKLVLVHALLAGLLNFIPNIGPATSVVFPIMIALLDAPWKIVAILIWYFFIQNLESYWLTPKVMAEKVSLLPAVTLFAQIFFAQTFGLIGLLLALPLTVVAKTWIEEVLFKDILDQWTIDEDRKYQDL